MLLQYIHIIVLPHDAIYFVKCTSPCCSTAPPKHDAATPVLHGWDGVLRLASLPLLPPNITMVIISIFISSDQRIFLQKVQSLSPCAFANRSLVLEQWLLPCWAAFQVMLSGISWYKTLTFTVDIDIFVPVSSSIFTVHLCIFTGSLAVVLGLICTFRTKVR